jgi:hypothetical protein
MLRICFSKYPSSVYSHENAAQKYTIKNAIRVPSPTTRPIAWVGCMTTSANVNDMIDPAARKKTRISNHTLIPIHAHMAIAKGMDNTKLAMKHSRFHRARFAESEQPKR